MPRRFPALPRDAQDRQQRAGQAGWCPEHPVVQGQASGDPPRPSPSGTAHVRVSYPRNGGDTPSLMKLLRSTSTSMATRYVNPAEADLASKHRRHSPADLLDE